ncbi:hypothetical protein PanWU01x14_321210, partial [Parasponia andersonii]
MNPRNEGKEYYNAIMLRSGKDLVKIVEKPISSSKPMVKEVVEEEQAKVKDGKKPID